MPNSSKNISRADLPEWGALDRHAQDLADLHIKALFEKDRHRFLDFHLRHDSLILDYSKQGLTSDTLKKLVALAQACDVEGLREKMFGGAAINVTEGRAVLHTALRAQGDTPISVDGEDVVPHIQNALRRMQHFCDLVRREKRFTHIVNIGIGGSDLGASVVYEALKPFADRDFHLHFVSNIDGTDLTETLRFLDPQTTLFVIASKTFTTQETVANMHSARLWLQDALGGKDISDHFVAVTGNSEQAREFGIQDAHIFPVWDWVGGRYSLWSAISISACIALGFDRFQELLAGARSMDQHFSRAPLGQNMPVLLAMIGVWNRNFKGYPALSITPYDQYLCRFPAYIQQLDMESNGKSVDCQGQVVDYDTGPLVLSDTGTNAQHAYFQMVHQGTSVIPCDFIVVAQSHNPIGAHHRQLLANAIGQSKALMDGRDDDDPHKVFEGNRPSNTLILDRLTPYTLGLLLALYEHKIFVQGVIWNINSFDQCGVELGKALAHQIYDSFDQDPENVTTDSSTRGIMQFLQDL